jgi:hypothetical protein
MLKMLDTGFSILDKKTLFIEDPASSIQYQFADVRRIE